jgi:hypothetical protein
MKFRASSNKIIHFTQTKNYKIKEILNKLIQKPLNSAKKILKIWLKKIKYCNQELN